MIPHAVRARALRRLVIAAAAGLAVAAPAGAAPPEPGFLDVRPAGGEVPEAVGERLRDGLGRFGLVDVEPRTDTVRAAGRLDGFLTGPSGRDAASVALGYVRDHPRAFGLDGDDLAGLRLVRRSSTGGIERLTWEQRHRGIPSADTHLSAAVSGAGRLLAVTGPAAADLAVRTTEPAVGARRAVAAAGRPTPVPAVTQRRAGARRTTTFAGGGRASLVVFQAPDGARLGWRVLAPVSSSEVYDAVVDARTGALVRRANLVDFAAPALVFRNTPEGTQVPVDFEAAGWLAPGAGTLKGPYAHAFVDRADAVGVHTGTLTPRPQDEVGRTPGPRGAGWEHPLRTFSTAAADGCSAAAPCTWDRRTPRSWEANAKRSATQLFYLVNTFRDHLAAAPIGFTDGGFAGDDPVLAQAMDGADTSGGLPDAAHVNNASFLTLPDGSPGLLRTHLFERRAAPAVFGDYDAADDASVVLHEYAHGLSNRLVTDAAGFGALNTPQAGALGEGTSDFYALDFLVASGRRPDAAGPDVRIGEYLDKRSTLGFRLQPIDTPRPAGTTYAAFRGDAGVHRNGEIWAQTLWDIRARLGAEKARRLVTNGLRMAPPEPSFLDMRNAILQASTEAADDRALWSVFAARGMGYFAATEDSRDVTPAADSTNPATLSSATGALQGTVTDEEGRPVAGARVGVAGHETDGLGAALASAADSAGAYAIRGLPAGRYPEVIARKPGFRQAGGPATVTASRTATLDLVLVRDWSSAAAGATIESFTGADHTGDGCGPGGLLDDLPGTVWSSDAAPGGQAVLVDLGAPVDIAGVAIDPGAGCGDGPEAALGGYALGGATGPAGPFVAVGAPGAFPSGAGGSLRDVPGSAAPRVRYLRLQALSPVRAGTPFVDVAELHVAKVRGSALGPAVETEAARAVSATGAALAGRVTPHAAGAQVVFEYGPTAGYGAEVAAGTLPPGGTAVPVTAAVGGLAPGTAYHFRAVAVRDGQRYPGADAAFRTPAAPPAGAPAARRPGAALAALRPRKLVAGRRGRFRVRVRFAPSAPPGRARLRVRAKGRTLATRRLTVRPGRTTSVRLSLSERGRRLVRRGRGRRVTLELRLPGGARVMARATLARRP